MPGPGELSSKLTAPMIGRDAEFARVHRLVDSAQDA